MPDKRLKRPRDPAQLAKLMIDIASGEVEDRTPPKDTGKNPAAVALGRLGGLKGGAARSAKLTAEQKRDTARRAAQVRWANRSKDDD
jgi:hypothetical protein